MQNSAADRREDRTIGAIRIGIGHDTHRLAEGGPLRIGGCDVPHDRHLVGHSDADVLLHAITDALLGAASLGDIGDHFPNTDRQNRGRDSAEMLQRVHERVASQGYGIGNLDCIVFAERPKLTPHKAAKAGLNARGGTWKGGGHAKLFRVASDEMDTRGQSSCN